MRNYLCLFFGCGVIFLSPVLTSSATAAPRTVVERVGYSVQVGAFKNVANAQRLAESLQLHRLDAFWFKKDDGLYAVRFGSFPSEQAAEAEALRLKTKRVVSTYFVTEPGSVAIESLAKKPLAEIKPAAESGLGITAARTAERFVGIPYRWGGNNVVEGLDCSGFVRAVYSLCGVQIPRTSADQFRTGREVLRDNVKEGDLVFFGRDSKVTHVGLYVGSGKFVHAPRRNEPIQVTPLADQRYAPKFMGVRRFFE